MLMNDNISLLLKERFKMDMGWLYT